MLASEFSIASAETGQAMPDLSRTSPAILDALSPVPVPGKSSHEQEQNQSNHVVNLLAGLTENAVDTRLP